MVRLRNKAKKLLLRAISLPATEELTCHLTGGYVVWTDACGVNTVIRLNNEENN